MSIEEPKVIPESAITDPVEAQDQAVADKAHYDSVIQSREKDPERAEDMAREAYGSYGGRIEEQRQLKLLEEVGVTEGAVVNGLKKSLADWERFISRQEYIGAIKHDIQKLKEGKDQDAFFRYLRPFEDEQSRLERDINLLSAAQKDLPYDKLEVVRAKIGDLVTKQNELKNIIALIREAM